MFAYQGEFFVNPTDLRVLDVSGNKDEEGHEVIVSKKNGGANQRWDVIYLDKAKAVPTKGFSEEFGFHINRPFYFVSRLPMHRVAECHGANNIWLKRYRKNVTAQQYYFDSVSKTLRSQQWKNYAMEIQSNGGSTNLRMTSGITSRWW